eukprot:660005-Rhodomonas_salina.1
MMDFVCTVHCCQYTSDTIKTIKYLMPKLLLNSPSGSLLLDFGGAFEAQGLNFRGVFTLTQTVEVSTRLELITLALLAPALRS